MIAVTMTTIMTMKIEAIYVGQLRPNKILWFD